MEKTPRAEVVEAQLLLIFAMIRAEYDPLTVAETARTAIYDAHPWTLTRDELASIIGVLWDPRNGQLRARWNQYTQTHKQFFEWHLVMEMERLFGAIRKAKSEVQQEALAYLSDPNNWPFDPDLSPEHETNVEAAKAHGVMYDPARRQYVDEDGCPKFDAFGQPL